MTELAPPCSAAANAAPRASGDRSARPALAVEDLWLEFLLFRNKGLRLKEYLVNLLSNRPRAEVEKFWVLRGLNLAFREGERVAVLGPNGAGKTTLLKTICGIYAPTRGRVRVGGRVTPLLEMGTAFHPEMTGAENIVINGAFMGCSPRVMARMTAEITAFSGLESAIDTPLKYYSSGMVQRLAFSIATAIQPDILVVDEIFAAGDIDFIGKSIARMHALLDRARLFLFVSHSTDLMRQLCARGVLLNRGRVVVDGPLEEAVAVYTAHPTPEALDRFASARAPAVPGPGLVSVSAAATRPAPGVGPAPEQAVVAAPSPDRLSPGAAETGEAAPPAWAGLILAAVAFFVALLWAGFIPQFEGPDEPLHIDVARYIAAYREVPVMAMPGNGPERLKYFTSGANFAARSLPAYAALAAAMEFGRKVEPTVPDVLWARVANAAFAGATVLFCFLLCRALFPGSPLLVWGPPALVGFWPQFTFVAGYANDDVFAVMCATAAFWSMARVLTRGWRPSTALALGVAAGAVAWAKPNALAIGAAAIPLLLFTLRPPWRVAARQVALCLLVTALIAGPWVWFYHQHYGGWLYGGDKYTQVMEARSHGAWKAADYAAREWSTWDQIGDPAFMNNFWLSFVGTFGWMKHFLPPAVYDAVYYIALAAIAGLYLALARAISVLLRRDAKRRGAAFVTAGAVSLFLAAGLALYLAICYARAREGYHPQGRYLFPVIAPFAVLLALGLSAWLPPRVQRAALPLWLMACAGFNGWALFQFYTMTYYGP